LTSLPAPPSGKAISDGGWLAYDSSRGLVYASKGNNSGDFYSYNPVTNDWTTLPSIPVYLSRGRGKKILPGAGSRGVSDGNGTVYMTVGSGTQGFFSFSSGVWGPLAQLPAKAGPGTDAAFAAGQVYVLNGPSSRLYRYSLTGRSWEDLGALPGTSAWGDGSWLVFDGMQTLYAHHKANDLAPYNEMWTYNLGTATWSITSRAGLPGAAALSGSAGAWFGGAIHALAGNSTREFWKQVLGSKWSRLDDIPAQVGAGGDICASGDKLFALSGGLTNKFWCYSPYGAVGAQPSPDGVTAAQALDIRHSTFDISLSPNPLSGKSATVRCNLPNAGSARVEVFNSSGRLVHSSLVTRQSSIRLDLRSLPAGVYVVRVEADGHSAAQKLVIER
jgi:hypothetical protein